MHPARAGAAFSGTKKKPQQPEPRRTQTAAETCSNIRLVPPNLMSQCTQRCTNMLVGGSRNDDSKAANETASSATATGDLKKIRVL